MSKNKQHWRNKVWQGEPNYAKQNLSQFHFIHTNEVWMKWNWDWTGIETWIQQPETGD